MSEPPAVRVESQIIAEHSARCSEGEMFERGKHASGTEVKAITYSNMQIREQPGDAEVFVIVDI